MTDLPDIDEAACLKVIVDLVKIDSRTLTPNEGAATDHIARVMGDLGIPAEVIPFGDDGRQNAVGTWGNGRGGGKTLLFNGHLDTNPVGEGWTVDPWGGVVKDDCVFGIGVSNMKSGCAAYLCAVMTLHQAGFRPEGKVLLTYVVGELQGGPGTQALIEKGYCNADFFINCEPSDVRAITMHAESLIFEIDLVGDTRHMSNREAATDAILAATDLIPRLTKLKYEGAISDDHLRCNRTHVGVLHSALGKGLNETRPPQVADYALIKGAARYGPGQTPRMVLRGLDKVCQETVAVFPKLQYTVRHIPSQTMPAFEVPKDAPIVRALNRAYEAVRGEAQPTGALTPVCFYGSDAGHLYRSLGMQGVVCGPGGKYNTMPDERVELKDYFDCIRVFIKVIADVVGVERIREP